MVRRSQASDGQGDLRMLYGDQIPPAVPVENEPPLYYHYPFEIVRLGWQLWKQNNFAYPIPDPEVLMDTSPRWLDDLMLYHQGVEYQKEVTKRELSTPQLPKVQV